MWCYQSKSMCVTVAESWRGEANRWTASSVCCEITECAALLTAPDGSLSEEEQSEIIQGLHSLPDTDPEEV